MFSTFWHIFLYQPVFNALIWIYSNITNFNLGWAVVWLTIFLRIILLPLTFISVRDANRQEKAREEAEKAARAFKNDPIARKEEIRNIMKKNHVSPWAKMLTLGLQLLVLVLLYQVFLGGITGQKMYKNLYPSVDFPGKININFYGFDIGRQHDVFWAGIVAIYLFANILWGNRFSKKWDSSKAAYLILFPLFTFTALWILPMVKSLFILTSMLFSDIISIARYIIMPKKKSA